jgi:hypothetical protein
MKVAHNDIAQSAGAVIVVRRTANERFCGTFEPDVRSTADFGGNYKRTHLGHCKTDAIGGHLTGEWSAVNRFVAS